MNLHDTQGRRLYLTADERLAFIAAATMADRPVRTLCTVLHDTSCRISEALAFTS
jgi:integrase/recombinase XerD